MMPIQKAEIISGLQTDILRLQGFKPANSNAIDFGLGPIKNAFPNSSFPLGCVHEFLAQKIEHTAATAGFISGMLGTLMGKSGTAVWISTSGKIYPPALRAFGIQPDRFIFIDVKRDKDVFWAMDEALKCGAIAAVVGELYNLDFTASRRLQLAVEQSKVTGFVLRKDPRNIPATACVSRWKISPLPTETIDNLPGIGFPKWRVELLRIRNGKAGVWDLQWQNGRFNTILPAELELREKQMKVG